MAFTKQTVKDIDLKDKKVIVRIDWDVPAKDDGAVGDDFRIRSSLETLEFLKSQNCKIIVMSKRGRPKANEEKLSMRKVAEKASELLGSEVKFAPEVFSETVVNEVNALHAGEILCLENLRFDTREKAKDGSLAKDLASLADVFVFDAFAMAHRNEVSCVGLNVFLPSVSGLLVEKEVTNILNAVNNPEKPVLAITGGSKLETKLPLLENFMKLADNIVVAGVMANTLLVAQGHSVGKSVYDEDELGKAREILELSEANNVEFILPTKKVAVGKSLDDENRVEKTLDELSDEDLILDFGQDSIDEVIDLINQAKTIIWNGPLGYYENPVFAEGSNQVAKAIAETNSRSVVGGGDTGDVVNSLGLADKFTHVSTGGGASLELLAGHKLPGIEALLDK